MNKPDTPDFAELLAPFIGAVPEEAVPNFLALLERGAAQRYREWAKQLPDFREGLSLFPISDELASAIREPLPAARDTYYQVFEHLSLAEQLAVQADAELQGAAAWRGMLEDAPDDAARAVLEHCAQTEEASADYLDGLLAELVKH